jgi:TRAP-type C4-dicarboxylate transport system permease small subunit
LCWDSWLLLLENYREGTNIYGAIVFQKYIIYIPAVIGIFLLLIQFLRQFVRAIQKLSIVLKKGS